MPDPNEVAAAVRAVGKALGDAGGTAIDRCSLYQDVVWQATLPSPTTRPA